jgi:RNA polymerase sigma-70 factor (ECF subfamily)
VAAQRRRSAFDELAEEARPLVYRRVLRVVRDETLADDVTARALAKAWRNRRRYRRERANGATWLYTIADRLALDALEQRRARQGREFSGFEAVAEGGAEEGDAPVRLEPEDDVEAPPPEEADRPLRQALVREALAKLSEGDRQLLWLREVEGLSSREIAARLGCPVGSVDPRLTRARKAFAQALDPEALG